MSDPERLKAIFQEVSDTDTVTEHQEEQRGSIIETTDDHLQDTITEYKSTYSFETTLTTSELATIIKHTHDGKSDREIATELGNRNLDKTVQRARTNLLFITDDDLSTNVLDINELETLLNDDTDYSNPDLADKLNTSTSTISKYRRLLRLLDRKQHTDYPERFENALDQNNLNATVAKDLIDDGLDDATDNTPSA